MDFFFNIKYKRFFLLSLMMVFVFSFTISGCSSEPTEELKVTKRMKIEQPGVEKKAAPKKRPKKVVKKKVATTKKPSIKWVNPKKATIKKKVTAKKTVVAKKESIAATTAKKIAAARPNYVVSVASFREESKARVLKAKLSKAGYKAYVTSTVKDGTTWYRVRCGFFDGYSEATRLKDKLVKQYFVKGAWVDRPTRAEVAEFAK